MKEDLSKKISLLNRLYAKFHNTKIYKTILGLALASAITLGSTGCGYIPFPDKGTTPNQGTHLVPDNGDETTAPSQTNQVDISQYSQMLQNVLTNEQYNNMIASARNGNPDLYNNGIFKPHPYAFLEDEGFNVDAIKNGSIDCYTMSYVLDEEPNNLYMYTRVTENDIVHNYLLKYHLTDQEMDDYDFVHDPQQSLASYFVQAMFLNNEISELKSPEIIGSSKMSDEALKKMTETMHGRHGIETDFCDIIMINPNAKEYYFRLILVPDFFNPNQAVVSKNSHIADLDCQAVLNYNGDIYLSPYTYGSFNVLNFENLDAKFYYPHNAKLDYRVCKDFADYTK